MTETSETVKEIAIEGYTYELPDDRIARHPLVERDRCKLLVRRPDGSVSDAIFSQLPELLAADTLMVYNDTRVINARLHFRKEGADGREGAQIEIFCLEPETPADYEQNFASTGCCSWLCFVGNSKRWKQGELHRVLTLSDGRSVRLTAERQEHRGNASVVTFRWDDPTVTFSQIIESAGVIPIPPYLGRETEAADATDYQTMFAHIEGSVAAPTAGLHFTPQLLQRLHEAGVKSTAVTLHVGAGTFQPVKSHQIGDHDMHSEWINVSADTLRTLLEAHGPVVAVGTTSVRTLESLYHIGCLMHSGEWEGEVPQWYPYHAEHPQLSREEALRTVLESEEVRHSGHLLASTRIIIAPGYRYMVVEGLITNFHQPQSTLLLLVSAMIGEEWRSLYAHALDNGYRFLSYGDACLFLPS